MDNILVLFILMLAYYIFFVWLVWVKAPWSTKYKILVTIGVVAVISLIPLGFMVLPESGGCEELMLGE